jgi:hypothetical protein
MSSRYVWLYNNYGGKVECSLIHADRNSYCVVVLGECKFLVKGSILSIDWSNEQYFMMVNTDHDTNTFGTADNNT